MVHSVWTAWAQRAARSGVTIAAALKPALDTPPAAAAHTAAAHTAAAHTAAAHTERERAARRSPAVARNRQAVTPVTAPQSQAAGRRLRSAKPWRRTDSCLRASQSGRDQPRELAQSPLGRLAGVNPRPARLGVVRSPAPVDRAAVAKARGLEDRRTVAGEAREAGVLPKPVRAAPAGERVVRLAQRGDCRSRAGELPQRPKGCRKKGKTCWWAGSTRRTAYTRSCEKLPSSSCAPHTCAAKRRQHTRFTASLRS